MRLFCECRCRVPGVASHSLRHCSASSLFDSRPIGDGVVPDRAKVELIEPAVKGTLNVDPKYVFDSNRLELRWEISLGTIINPRKADVSANNSDGENRLLKSQEATSSGSKANEVSLLQSNRPMSSCSQKAKYPFICECFFMIASVLNLGLLKAFSDFKNLVQVVHFLVWQ
ncbi:unnamed protein product [Fraxinus pennsylvanica]|uniref:Ubiquitin conjugation factor E4 core domain-containing protein n=1 Tax=Fraxinus pennsylvanica TaxID=56036 RepID=A0AAD2AAW7_9LAMI|nr:unnamed protein product [Fraxinus pennsylvanica]